MISAVLSRCAEQLPVHALDRAGDRVGAAAHQRVAGVGREVDRLAGWRLQARRPHLERAQRQAVARQNQTAEETPLGVERVDRHRRADHHDERQPRRTARGCVTGADQRDPAVDAGAGSDGHIR
jgi:hypothetical protein